MNFSRILEDPDDMTDETELALRRTKCARKDYDEILNEKPSQKLRSYWAEQSREWFKNVSHKRRSL